MARITFVVPMLDGGKLAGGPICILQYAHGLNAMGHDVSVLPILPSGPPEWFERPFGALVSMQKRQLAEMAFRDALGVLRSVSKGCGVPKGYVKKLLCDALLFRPGVLPQAVRMSLAEMYIMSIAKESDVVVATSFDTVRPALLLSGKKYLFAQHYESLFAEEFEDPHWSETVASESYRCGLSIIANSSWLEKKILTDVPYAQLQVCPNAIDHEIFNGNPKPATNSRRVTLISYGGRNARWKGFREMAIAVAMARAQLPEYDIAWNVYGDALVAPNEIAQYRALGQLSQRALACEYRAADILVSGSWYESFPLFPIEAMASGLAVITTAPGTEEYAEGGVTAEVVEPRSPESICEGIVRLVKDPERRFRIAAAGRERSLDFHWPRSVERFARCIGL